MPVLETQATTENATRYLVQFCRHAESLAHRGHAALRRLHSAQPGDHPVAITAEHSDTDGSVTFGSWGRCTVSARHQTLTLRIVAADEAGLARIRDIVTRDFERFTQRAPILLTWTRLDPPLVDDPTGPGDDALRHPHGRRPVRQIVLLILGIAAVAGVHLGLAGTLMRRFPWTGVAADVVLALILVKLALIATLGFRRTRAARARAGGRG